MRGTYEFQIHYARVILSEARRRRVMGHRGFAFTLLDWAGKARREAMQMRADEMPLFAGLGSPA